MDSNIQWIIKFSFLKSFSQLTFKVRLEHLSTGSRGQVRDCAVQALRGPVLHLPGDQPPRGHRGQDLHTRPRSQGDLGVKNTGFAVVTVLTGHTVSKLEPAPKS